MVVVLTTSTSTLFVLTLSLSSFRYSLSRSHKHFQRTTHIHLSLFTLCFSVVAVGSPVFVEWVTTTTSTSSVTHEASPPRARALSAHSHALTHARTHANTHAVCCLQSSATPLLLCWLPFVFARGQSLSQKVVLSGDCCFLLLRSRSKYLRTHKNKRKLV